jgi:hypothetical protein
MVDARDSGKKRDACCGAAGNFKVYSGKPWRRSYSPRRNVNVVQNQILRNSTGFRLK